MKDHIIDVLAKKYDRSLITDLIDSYEKIQRHYFLGNFMECLLFGGHFAEIILKILYFKIKGKKLSKIGNKQKIIEEIGNSSQLLSEVERIIIPRLIGVVHDLRNRKRSGHATEILPTKNDALLVHRITTYVLIELLMLENGMNYQHVRRLVENLIERKIPIIEVIDDVVIGDDDISIPNLILLTLYNHENGSLTRKDLLKKLEAYDLNNVQSSISKLKKKRKIYINPENKVFLTSIGRKRIEEFVARYIGEQFG